MILDEIVSVVRSLAGDVDPAAFRFSTNAIAVALNEARRLMGVRRVAGMSDLAVDTAEGAEAISPEPSDEQGLLLAYGAAIKLLWQRYTYLIDSGGMGVIWRSGLEQESTVAAQAAYEGRIKGLERTFEELRLIGLASTAGVRPQ